MLRTILIAIAFCSCKSPQAAPALRGACGGGCTISSQCSDIFSSCRVCFNGRCAESLPASPLDAGLAPGEPLSSKGPLL